MILIISKGNDAEDISRLLWIISTTKTCLQSSEHNALLPMLEIGIHEVLNQVHFRPQISYPATKRKNYYTNWHLSISKCKCKLWVWQKKERAKNGCFEFEMCYNDFIGNFPIPECCFELSVSLEQFSAQNGMLGMWNGPF